MYVGVDGQKCVDRQMDEGKRREKWSKMTKGDSDRRWLDIKGDSGTHSMAGLSCR